MQCSSPDRLTATQLASRRPVIGVLQDSYVTDVRQPIHNADKVVPKHVTTACRCRRKHPRVNIGRSSLATANEQTNDGSMVDSLYSVSIFNTLCQVKCMVYTCNTVVQ
jgi:hypothetical protein